MLDRLARHRAARDEALADVGAQADALGRARVLDALHRDRDRLRRRHEDGRALVAPVAVTGGEVVVPALVVEHRVQGTRAIHPCSGGARVLREAIGDMAGMADLPPVGVRQREVAMRASGSTRSS
ncbi:MAG: hypothetical protein MUF21_10565 [Gemmatimonadaceae bacterium]|nr:hypothetical protein [Gemmatimonadaceae bacterium]